MWHWPLRPAVLANFDPDLQAILWCRASAPLALISVALARSKSIHAAGAMFPPAMAPAPSPAAGAGNETALFVVVAANATVTLNASGKGSLTLTGLNPQVCTAPCCDAACETLLPLPTTGCPGMLARVLFPLQSTQHCHIVAAPTCMP